MEQQIVDHLGVAQGQDIELLGQGKDHMEVGHRQKLIAATVEPALLFQTLALGAVAVATGVVADLLGAALVAAINVSTQNRGAAVFDGPHGLQLHTAKSMVLSISFAVEPKDVGHLQAGGARHGGPTSVRVPSSPAGPRD